MKRIKILLRKVLFGSLILILVACGEKTDPKPDTVFRSDFPAVEDFHGYYRGKETVFQWGIIKTDPSQIRFFTLLNVNAATGCDTCECKQEKTNHFYPGDQSPDYDLIQEKNRFALRLKNPMGANIRGFYSVCFTNQAGKQSQIPEWIRLKKPLKIPVPFFQLNPLPRKKGPLDSMIQIQWKPLNFRSFPQLPQVRQESRLIGINLYKNNNFWPLNRQPLNSGNIQISYFVGTLAARTVDSSGNLSEEFALQTRIHPVSNR